MGYSQDLVEEAINRRLQYDKKYAEMEKQTKEERDKLFLNEDFITWLVGNIENYGRDIYVSTDDNNLGNKLDEEHQRELVLFFQGVDFYAVMNDIQDFNDISSCKTYYVLYEDFGFCVSCQYGDSTTWRITRIDPVNPEMFIDFRRVLKFYKDRHSSRNRKPEDK